MNRQDLDFKNLRVIGIPQNQNLKNKERMRNMEKKYYNKCSNCCFYNENYCYKLKKKIEIFNITECENYRDRNKYRFLGRLKNRDNWSTSMEMNRLTEEEKYHLNIYNNALEEEQQQKELEYIQGLFDYYPRKNKGLDYFMDLSDLFCDEDDEDTNNNI